MPWQPRAKTDLQLTRLRTALERAPDGFFEQLAMPADTPEAQDPRPGAAS